MTSRTGVVQRIEPVIVAANPFPFRDHAFARHEFFGLPFSWSIHRIWSTDWFQRPDEQLQAVLHAVEEAKSYWRQLDEQEGSQARSYRPQTTIQTVDEDSFWERIEVEPSDQQEDENQNGYQQAVFFIRDYEGTPNDLSVRDLAIIIKKVVEIEAPIHLEEIGRRCIDILSQGRLTAKLKDSIETAVSYLLDRGVKRQGDFVYMVSQAEFPVRDRSEIENPRLRKVEFIPPEEIRTAIISVITEHIGTDERETASSVAKLLGISNTRNLQEAVQDHIRQLTSDEAIEDRSGKLFVQ